MKPTRESLIQEVDHLIETYSRANELDEPYYNRLIKKLKKEKLWEELGHVYCCMAGIYFNVLEDYNNASLVLNKCKLILTKTKGDNLAIRYHSVMANFYKVQFEFENTIYHLKLSLDKISNITDRSHYILKIESYCFYSMALVFDTLGEHNKYIFYIKKAWKSARKIENETMTANCIAHYGVFLLKNKEFNKSEKFLLKAISILQAGENNYALGNAKYKLGLCYFNQEQYHISLKLFLEGLEVISSVYPISDFCIELIQIGLNYKKLDNIENAKQYFHVAYDRAYSRGNKEILLTTIDCLSIFYEEIEDYRTALKYHNEMKELKEKIRLEDRERIINDMEEKYQSALKQKEINFRKKKQRETERHIGLVEEQNQLTKSMIALLNKGLKNPVRQGKQMLALLNRGGIRQEDKAKIISSIQEYFEQIEQFSKDVKEIIHTDSKEALGEKLDAATIASLVNKNLSGKKDEFDLDRAKYPKTYFIQEHVSRLAKHAEQSNKIMPLMKGRSSGVLI